MILENLLIERIRQLSSPLAPQPTGMAPRLTQLAGIKAILFDVYGTLFISGSGDISLASAISNQQALTEALECTGFSGDLEQAGAKGKKLLLEAIRYTHTCRKAQGIAYPEVDIRDEWQAVLTTLLQEGLIQGNLSSELILRVSMEYEFRVNPVWPMPGAMLALQELREKQIVLGIVSNAQFYTLLMFPALLGKSHIDSGFASDLCAWSYEVSEAKPSVTLFQKVLKPLQQTYRIAPEETLYVGNDMLNDIWTAAQCGLKTALFTGDQRSLRLREQDTRCADLEPDLVITHLSQLLAFYP